jgi:hypothetical protein
MSHLSIDLVSFLYRHGVHTKMQQAKMFSNSERRNNEHKPVQLDFLD